MTTISASIHVTLGLRVCADCRKTIVPSKPYMRLFGMAEDGDPPYEMFVCLVCARASEDVKVKAVIGDWDKAHNVRINEHIIVRFKALNTEYVMRMEQDPNFVPPRCTVPGCEEIVDITMTGVDTSCPYHRLLFDWWLYEVAKKPIEVEYPGRKARSRAFMHWVRRTGKRRCDEIVDKMSKDGINWTC